MDLIISKKRIYKGGQTHGFNEQAGRQISEHYEEDGESVRS